MARLVGSTLALLMCLVGLSKAFNISEFELISKGGVSSNWKTDDFGLAFGNGTLYMVSRLNGTAVLGGIVSALGDNGEWKHTSFEQLDEARFHDELFTLAGRLFMLTVGDKDDKMDNRIVFSKLFAWDGAKWTAVDLDMPDKDNVFQPLTRGPNNFVSIDVPDQDGKVAYVVATDHEMAKNDSETSFSKLSVDFDDATGKPRKASLKFIARVKSNATGKAVIASAFKSDVLYPITATFPTDNTNVVKLAINYTINLVDSSIGKGVEMNPLERDPEIDYTVGKRRIFQAREMLLILGPHKLDDKDSSTAIRHVWDRDLDTMQLLETDAKFPNLPNRIFAIDQEKKRLLTADTMKGAFAAKITFTASFDV